MTYQTPASVLIFVFISTLVELFIDGAFSVKEVGFFFFFLGRCKNSNEENFKDTPNSCM